MKWHWELEICPRLGSSAGKESICNAGGPGLIPGSGRSPGEGMGYPLQYSWTSLVAQPVKNLPATWDTWVRSLRREDPLEKGITTHSSFLAWRIPRTEEPGGLQSMELQGVRHGWATNTFTSLHWINTIQMSVIISTSGMWLTDLVNEPTMLGFSITKPFKCFFLLYKVAKNLRAL